MAMYIGQSKYNVYFVNGNSTVEGDAEQAVADLIEGTTTQISNGKVTSIRAGYFQSDPTLAAVDFPECLSIGSSAFSNCSALNTASFQKCTTIGSSAFRDCYNLHSISFPECSVIEYDAFGLHRRYDDNNSLITVSSFSVADFPNCTTIGDDAFYAQVDLNFANFPNCTTIGDSAFYQCQTLDSINFPNCTTIGNNAFYNIFGLRSVVSLPSCTKIGCSAFAACYYLKDIYLPVCSEIGSSAFRNCSSLPSINLPNCTTIGDEAFGSCSILSSVSLPNCTTIGGYTFRGCEQLSEINLPALIATPNNAFRNLSTLVSISLPTCTSVGVTAFASCTSLTSMNLPACTTISSSAFQQCQELSMVTFSSLSYIDSGAFSSCTKLMNLTNHYSSVASLYNTSAFYATPMSVSTYTGSFGSIYVPASLVSLYKTATNWAAYANRITPLDGIDQIDDIVIGYNLTKSIIAPLIRFESIPENISVVSNNENIVVSNIQATTESITFDITSTDITERAECSIEATYNEGLYTMTFGISVVPPIDINSMAEKFGVDRTISASLPYYGDSAATGLSVTSSDESRLSISNVQLVDNAITFDATTYDVVGEVSIVISITYGGKTYSQTKVITISRAPIYTIEDLGTTYGFDLNDNGYYESNNKGVQNSFAICKVNISTPTDCTMYLDCINYAEANYDYGILSNLDTTLSLSSSADSSYKKSFKGSSMATVQTVSYDITAGEHFIYVKYRKDNSGDSLNDSLQFAVRFVKKITYTNIVPFSFDENGSDYNSGLGYCNGVALDDTGSEVNMSDYTVTGYLDGEKGGVFRFKNYGLSSEAYNCLVIYDEYLNFCFAINFTSETDDLPNGVSFSNGVLTFDSGAVTAEEIPDVFAIRLSTKASGENLIVTYDEEINDGWD